MDPYGKNELISFYDRHLKHFGDHPQAVRWTPEGQRVRYEAFLGIAGDLSGKKLLDFGCGKGDFLEFLRSKSVHADYCGIDVNESLTDFARNKFPGAEFIALDIEEEDPAREFDVIIACGVFNLRIGGIGESMHNALARLFRVCREAMHVNFLSWHIARRDVELFYIKPDELVQFAQNELSSSFVLRTNLVKGDLFLSVYK